MNHILMVRDMAASGVLDLIVFAIRSSAAFCTLVGSDLTAFGLFNLTIVALPLDLKKVSQFSLISKC